MPEAILILMRLAVQESRARVTRQQAMVEEIVRAGRDAAFARKLLATFEVTLALQRRHLKTCEAQFADRQSAIARKLLEKNGLRLVWSRDVRDDQADVQGLQRTKRC